MAGAVLHAAWNAIVKSASDKLLTSIMVAVAAAAVSGGLAVFLPRPAAESWPYLAGSAALQVSYFILLARAYEVADMSQTYPVMRGTAPLLVAIVSLIYLQEPLTLRGWIGLTVVCGGVFGVVPRRKMHDRRGIYLALVNAGVIACYTLVDGTGVRLSGAPMSYTLWVFILTGLPLGIWALMGMRRGFVSYARHHWRLGIAGGIGTTASYGMALWAMTLTPVAVVAALRETSILFGTVIAGFVLKEHIGLARALAAIAIAVGAALLRLA